MSTSQPPRLASWPLPRFAKGPHPVSSSRPWWGRRFWPRLGSLQSSHWRLLTGGSPSSSAPSLITARSSSDHATSKYGRAEAVSVYKGADWNGRNGNPGPFSVVADRCRSVGLVTAELVLAPLACGDYVIEISGARPSEGSAETQHIWTAFRVVR